MKLRIATCLIAVCLLGCEPKSPNVKVGGPNTTGTAHAHEHDAPTTLPDAVKQLATHTDTISKAFTDKKPEDAHDSLHDVGHVLEAIPGLAKDLSDEKKTAIKKSVDELFACFGALDENLHGGPETPYSKIEDRVKTAMTELKSAIE